MVIGTCAASAAWVVACGSSSSDSTTTDSPDATSHEEAGSATNGDGSPTSTSNGDGAARTDATTPGDDDAADGSMTENDGAPGDDTTSDGGDSGGSSKDAGADAQGGQDAGADADAGSDASVTANVHYYGRFDTSSASGPSFDWSGTSMLASFTGTGVAVKLYSYETGATNPAGSGEPDHNEMEVVIDGTPAANNAALVLSAGTQVYQLKTGLSAGTTHTVQLYKRTEAEYGSIQFLGFQADTGDTGWTAKATVDPYTRHIEVIGDSITCGYGTLSTTTSCSGSTYNDEEDEYLAWGAVTARNLSAGLSVVSYSGKGVVYNLDGSTTDTVPLMYPRTLWSETTSAYNFALQVDAVVVNLGTNDYSYAASGAGGNTKPGSSFESTYETFVRTIRGHYPNAYILLAAGPMITANNPYAGALTDYDAYLQQVVNNRMDAGDTKIGKVDVGSQDCAMEQCGCDDHPNVTRQNTMATVVTSALRTALNWQ